jgi:hypothetical protein
MAESARSPLRDFLRCHNSEQFGQRQGGRESSWILATPIEVAVEYESDLGSPCPQSDHRGDDPAQALALTNRCDTVPHLLI